MLFELHPFEIFTGCRLDDMADVETMLLVYVVLLIRADGQAKQDMILSRGKVKF